MLMRSEECQGWEKRSQEKKNHSRDREGKKAKITGKSRRKKESKRYDEKIAASEESRHLLSALHLSAVWKSNACWKAYIRPVVLLESNRCQAKMRQTQRYAITRMSNRNCL